MALPGIIYIPLLLGKKKRTLGLNGLKPEMMELKLKVPSILEQHSVYLTSTFCPASLDLSASELQVWQVLAACWMPLEKCHQQEVDQLLDFECREWLQELRGLAPDAFDFECREWLQELRGLAPKAFDFECREWLQEWRGLAPKAFDFECCRVVQELRAPAPKVFGCRGVQELRARAPKVSGCGAVQELRAPAPKVSGCGAVQELRAPAPKVSGCGAVQELRAPAPKVLDFECRGAVQESRALAPKIFEIDCCAVVPPEFAARQNHVVQSQQGFGAQHVASVGLAFWEQLCHVDQSLLESSVLRPDFPQLTSLSLQSPRTRRCLILAPSGDLANPALPPNYSIRSTLANLVPHSARNLFLMEIPP